MPTGLPGLVISKKFKSALESAGADNIDYYPVKIIDEKTKEEHNSYYVANITGLIDCIDLDRSEYEPMIGFPEKIFALYIA